MRILELLGHRDSGYSVTTTNEATGGSLSVVAEWKTVTVAEDYDALANDAADAAMHHGLGGYAVTAEIAAALADAYADLAKVARWIENSKDALRRSA